MQNSDGIIVILSYPDTIVRPAYWEKSSKIWPIIGIGGKHAVQAGHAALLLIKKGQKKIEYFDFGRYITTYRNGRVRGEETDPELVIPISAEFKNDELLNIDETQLVGIKDLQTGEVVNLRDGLFEISLEKGVYNQRFSIVFKPQYYPLTEVDLFDGIFINMNNNDHILNIRRIVDTEIKNIQLFNYMGQSMLNWSSNLNTSTISKPINNLATGVYIVQVTTKDGVVNKKIIIE